MLASRITWLDHDAAARERSQRILALFKERGTRDELGLGAVRDNLAEALFPGTSTIQTRLRYMLFVPWIYQRIEDELGSGKLKPVRISARAEQLEYEIVDYLGEAGDQVGVFGRSAGRRLKRLPSSVYWAGLDTWGVRVVPLTQDQYHRELPALVERRRDAMKAGMEGDDVGRDDGALTWHPGLPPAPDGFPKDIELGLESDEADFLLDRVRQRHPASLLAHLFEQCSPAECTFPWEHPDRAGFSEAHQSLLDHAEKLSLLAQGAFLIYNLALSELQGAEERIERRRMEFSEWSDEVREAGLNHWDLRELWEKADRPYRVSLGARNFLESWLERVRDARGNPGKLLDDPGARELIRRRESLLKGPRSRFANPQALEQWGGSSGVARYRYRWPTVSQFHQDLHDGLSREGVL